VLLAAFIPARPGEAVLEAGCGSGAAFLCLAARVRAWPSRAGTRSGPRSPRRAQRRAERRRRRHPRDRPARGTAARPIDHAFANPPYWPDGTASPDAARRQAAHVETPLAEWVQALAAPLRRRGSLSLVLPASRWSEAAAALRLAGLGALRLLPLRPRAGFAAKRVLLGGRRDARGPDELLPGLVLHEAGGAYTQAAEAVLRDAQPLAQPS
jgi:tRNA1(Val) A37 N6-methylase TrmN6